MVVPVPKDIETKPHVQVSELILAMMHDVTLLPRLQQPAKHAIDYPSDDSEDEIITLPVCSPHSSKQKLEPPAAGGGVALLDTCLCAWGDASNTCTHAWSCC